MQVWDCGPVIAQCLLRAVSKCYMQGTKGKALSYLGFFFFPRLNFCLSLPPPFLIPFLLSPTPFLHPLFPSLPSPPPLFLPPPSITISSSQSYPPPPSSSLSPTLISSSPPFSLFLFRHTHNHSSLLTLLVYVL